jgi:ADP-ribose pyrophosphatase YjhB (NUDIX family)
MKKITGKKLVKQTRQKSAIVPYVVTPEGNIFILLVYSNAFKEWSIITGGCKMTETVQQCGLREFAEETNNIFVKHHPQLKFMYHFETGDLNETHRLQNLARGFDVTYRYNVFFCQLPHEVMSDASTQYSRRHRSGDENDKIAFQPYNSQHLHSLNMWDITQNELCSRHFRDLLMKEITK